MVRVWGIVSSRFRVSAMIRVRFCTGDSANARSKTSNRVGFGLDLKLSLGPVQGLG
jgi:hypothetical protein